MPSNSTGTIAIWRDANAVAAVHLSPQETGVRVRAVPAGGAGTTVDLPTAQPTDGDAYDVIDADGSSSTAKPIVIVPPAGTTIRGGASFSLVDPFASARVTFDASADDWTIEEGVGGGSASIDAPWHDVAAGTVFQSSNATPYVSCDSTAAQSTVKLDPAPFDGQVQTVRLTGTTQVTPVLVLAQGVGNTVESVVATGTFGANTFLAIQCELASWKYDKATTQWKLYAHTLGSGAAAQAATTWAVDYAAGLNTNSGAPGSPLARVDEIRRRWNGGIAGANPTLSGIARSLTIAGVAPDTTDPVAALWDGIVAQTGFALSVTGTTTIKRAGQLATYTAMARTSTGQPHGTDAGVADWTGDIDHLVVDTTQVGSVWWVTTKGAGNIGVFAVPFSTIASAAAAVAAMTGLVHVTPVGTDHYNVLTMPQCYIGSGAFRSQTGGQAVVWLSRLHGIASSGTDTMIVTGDGSFIFDAFVGGYVLATECQLDQQCSSGGGFYMLNCSRGPDTGASRIDHLATAAESIAVFGGYARLSLDLVGGVFIDQDHYRLGGHNVTVESGTRTFFGNFGRFLETAAAENVFLIFGSIVQGAEFDAQGVSYGTTKGSEFADFADGGTIFAFDPAATDYAYDGGGAETFVFDFGQNAFGINPATGLPVGPTTPTLTHLDAALGVGTGFGSRAVEPASGCRFLVNGT